MNLFRISWFVNLFKVTPFGHQENVAIIVLLGFKERLCVYYVHVYLVFAHDVSCFEAAKD